jgi:hypothetical protein
MMKYCDDCGKEVGTLYRLKETKYRYLDQVCFHCYSCLFDPFFETASEFLPKLYTKFNCSCCGEIFAYKDMIGTEDAQCWLVCLDCLPRVVEVI